MFNSIRIVKAFSSEDKELKLYDALLKENENQSLNSSLWWSTSMGVVGFMTYASLIFIVYVGMILVSNGEATPGDLSSFVLFALSVANSMKDISSSIMTIRGSLPIVKKVFDNLEEPPKIPYKGGKIPDDFKGVIKFEKVEFKYASSPRILKGVSLSIQPKDVIAFVGSSGGGKSTIISLLQRFYDVTGGQITVDGINIKEIDLKWFHEQIGYVPQDSILFSGTIEENICYGVENYSQTKLNRIIKMANADFIFNRNLFPDGLATTVGERGLKLSGGQKQRLAIARALMKEPKILIFDEATSSLDTESEA